MQDFWSILRKKATPVEVLFILYLVGDVLAILCGVRNAIVLMWLIAFSFVLLLIAIFMYKRERFTVFNIFILVVLLLLSYVFIGSYKINREADYNSLKPFFGKTIYVEGKCSSFLLHGKMKISFNLDVEKIKTNRGVVKNVNARVRAICPGFNDVRYGDMVRIYGTLVSPFDGKAGYYGKYLYINGINGYIYSQIDEVEVLAHGSVNIFDRIRDYIYYFFFENLMQRYYSVVDAIVIGERGEIDKEIINNYKRSGIMHMFALSGLHIGIISIIVIYLFKLLHIRKNISYIALIFIVIFYALMIGYKPSIVRASIMAVVLYISLLTSRHFDIYNALALSGLIILTLNPYAIMDAGFLLSFLATFGIAFLYPRVRNYINQKGMNNIVIDAIIVSLSAWIFTFPIVSYFFGGVSLIGLVFNIVSAPIAFLLVLFSFISLFVGLVFMPLANAYLGFVRLLIDILNYLSGYVSSIPFSYINIRFSLTFVFIYYIGIGVMFLIVSLVLKKKAMKQRRKINALI